MGRRLIAALWLLLLVVSQAVMLARPVGAKATQDCRCDARLCRCAHQHGQPIAPRCHFPGGSNLPTLQSCRAHEEESLAPVIFILPPRAQLVEPIAGETLTPLSARRPPVASEDINPPPPRTPLA